MVKRKGNHTGETKKYFICAETIKDANGVRIIGLIKTGKDWRVVKMSEEEIKEIIDTIKQEEFPYALAIAKAYEKLEEENKNLKEKLEENTKIYLHTSKYASEMESKYIELNYILTEFEKWLENEVFNKTQIHFQYSLALRNCLDKMLELKEGSRSE